MLSPETFLQQFSALLPSLTRRKFLLAVSGGVDSMVLAWLFAHCEPAIAQNFCVAHINYKLRGEASDLDQKLVENFCETHKIPLFIYEVSEKDQKPANGSIQLWGRELRYRFFREVMQEKHFDFLVTAHHLNDQLETFLINLSRGSGLSGLCGIPADENHILRPLLAFSKQEIYDFAKENAVPYREDASNQKNEYLRNQFRNKIIPELMAISPKFLKSFQKSVQILKQNKAHLQNEAQKFLSENAITKENALILDKNNLLNLSDLMKYEILSRFGFDNEQEIQKIFRAEIGKTFISKDFELTIDRQSFVLRRKMQKTMVSEKDTKKIALIFIEGQKNYQLNLQNILDTLILDKNKVIIPYNARFSDENKVITPCNGDFFNENKEFHFDKRLKKSWDFDKTKVFPPFYARKPLPTDVFQPKGMQGKKKISKFLKDEKLSVLDKENIWVICDSKEQILGVFPLRQDRRWV